MNAIYTVFELIEVLRLKKGMSSRQLALSANVSTATLASLMNRKPSTISIETLDRLAKVFDERWFSLLNKPESITDEYALEKRISVSMERSDIEEVGYRLTKDNAFMTHVDRLHQLDIREAQAFGFTKKEVITSHEKNGFKSSIFFVLDKLNDDGLMEAMRRILDVANDPQYRKSSVSFREESALKFPADNLP